MDKIYEIKQYTDEEGKAVTARVTINPISLKPVEVLNEVKLIVNEVRFFGTYTIPHPKMGPMRFQFEFPEGWTLEECFNKFEQEAKKDFDKLQEEAQKEAATPKIWTPGQSQGNGGLIVPN